MSLTNPQSIRLPSKFVMSWGQHVITLVTSDELYSVLLRINPGHFLLMSPFLYTEPLVKLVGVGFLEHMGSNSLAVLQGLVAMVTHTFFSEILPDPEDLRGQSLCHCPTKTGHSRALLRHERLPKKAGRGGWKRHMLGLWHSHQGAAFSGEVPGSVQDMILWLETLL